MQITSTYHACELLDIDHIDKSEKKPNIAKIPFLQVRNYLLHNLGKAQIRKQVRLWQRAKKLAKNRFRVFMYLCNISDLVQRMKLKAAEVAAASMYVFRRLRKIFRHIIDLPSMVIFRLHSLAMNFVLIHSKHFFLSNWIPTSIAPKVRCPKKFY